MISARRLTDAQLRVVERSGDGDVEPDHAIHMTAAIQVHLDFSSASMMSVRPEDRTLSCQRLLPPPPPIRGAAAGMGVGLVDGLEPPPTPPPVPGRYPPGGTTTVGGYPPP
jgi:hypothetical protein